MANTPKLALCKREGPITEQLEKAFEKGFARGRAGDLPPKHGVVLPNALGSALAGHEPVLGEVGALLGGFQGQRGDELLHDVSGLAVLHIVTRHIRVRGNVGDDEHERHELGHGRVAVPLEALVPGARDAPQVGLLGAHRPHQWCATCGPAAGKTAALSDLAGHFGRHGRAPHRRRDRKCMRHWSSRARREERRERHTRHTLWCRMGRGGGPG
mmetsp:Transcript_129654/g.415840  ORF Transcript_129654/g.415840 Transcript_129654/m.415840 type:complete len:213 (+) Transcript_129654:3370-4008(+)